ncbi:DUF2059 domain-containing protein [Microbulbifer sp. A4B17]|uniref:DUF2059 domain-containing protein n=1 Tax=Microbulbifer sp. A4B17 TaxID=359370 RepID=UPI0013009F15|nr:DUF2059 domain-containing protein [Microbulbifer sp. A4B17]
MGIQAAKFVFAVFISTFCSLCLAADKVAGLDKLLLLSGFTKQIEELPGVVKSGFEEGAQKGAPIPEDELKRILESVDKTILPSVIMNEARSSLSESLTEKDIEALLVWYESDLGKKITAAEEKASTGEAYQELMVNAQQLMLDTKRIEVATRIDQLVGATDMAMEMQATTGIAVYSAIMTMMAPGQDINLDAYKAQMEAMKPQMRQSIEQLVAVSFVYTYQGIDDASLAKYEEFLSKPETKKFNSSAIKGLNKGFAEVVGRWSGDLASILKGEANM